jgi:GAF domain-containing protein
VDADRLARVQRVLARSEGSVVDGLLELSLEMLGLAGASIAVIGDGQHLGRFAAMGEVASVVDELQFSLGEGPGLTADHDVGAVLEPDLTEALGVWPAFAEAALAHGVAAVFAFPLRIGGVRLGVLSLYRSEPGELDGVDLADAVALARILTFSLLELEGDLAPGSLPRYLAEIVDHRASIHQATGMIAAQLDTGVRAALGRLQAYAWARDRSLGDVADDVVGRRLRFDEGDEATAEVD